jgi:hypothetical protein
VSGRATGSGRFLRKFRPRRGVPEGVEDVGWEGLVGSREGLFCSGVGD